MKQIAERTVVVGSSILAGNANYLIANATELDWIKQDQGSSVFDSVQATVKREGMGGINLVMIIAVILLIGCIIAAGLSIALGGKNDRGEGKTWITKVAVGGIIVFGATSIVTVLARIGNSITF